MSTYNQTLEVSAAKVCHYLREASRNLSAQQAHYCAAIGAVHELEEKLKRHYRMKHAVCVSNATTGLLVIGMAVDLKGCDIVTTPVTYGATVAGAMILGNRPVFADVDKHTLTLDPFAARKVITDNTGMLLGVDAFGTPADSLALRRLADAHGLWYISDSSQSLGSRMDGLPGGAHADALVVSFTAGKTLFAGEGGAIVTNNTALYEKLIWYSQHPNRQIRELGLHHDNEFALNARISPTAAIWANGMFAAALGKLKRYQEKCNRLIEALNDSGLTQILPFEERAIEPAFFRITAVWKGRPHEITLLQFLRARKFKVAIAPVPARLLYQQPAFVAQNPSPSLPHHCPTAEKQLGKAFCLSFVS